VLANRVLVDYLIVQNREGKRGNDATDVVPRDVRQVLRACIKTRSAWQDAVLAVARRDNEMRLTHGGRGQILRVSSTLHRLPSGPTAVRRCLTLHPFVKAFAR